ncbi:L-lactate dehydrogenase [Iocasia frigidifontis]|uniref:L-lactate dehydrogenase n=1 Tax=Iocasia fonsfrigidae TaxID=2682810 RepID=A0A8A7KGM5_9FIRM|nr:MULTISPECIES: L-lactate dehydrogenase [Halanaerobiaceae]AZO94114.1 L-lactate dehydrogenase [Halocella sp. SP3-1]QTL97032.1 L-lactate dehydrogenase [Iocasia fonsfrigidae]
MKNKVVIIGAGLVGATAAYAIMNRGLASEIVLVDINKERAEGEAMDLNHGAAFVKPVKVKHGGYEECRDARIVIISAGVNQKPGETRLDLVKKNTEVFKKIIPNISKYTREAILLVVTNPVDILTYVTQKLSDLPQNMILGSGTVLDTSRFRYQLSDHCGVNPKNIHAYIIGEHGDHEVAAWSLTNVAGVPFKDYCIVCDKDCATHDFRDKMSEKVRQAAYEIIDRKGATYYAVGLAVARIVESIFRDEHTILTVSTLLTGEYGIDDLVLSIPSIVGSRGVEKVLNLTLSSQEEEELLKSAGVLKGIIQELDI